jgi:hypothetical protein
VIAGLCEQQTECGMQTHSYNSYRIFQKIKHHLYLFSEDIYIYLDFRPLNTATLVLSSRTICEFAAPSITIELSEKHNAIHPYYQEADLNLSKASILLALQAKV